MVVYADPREPDKMVGMLLSLGLEVRRRILDVADYLVRVPAGHASVAEIPVERKTVEDYIASIEDGRLSRQLHGMSAEYPLSYLVIVGCVTPVLMERRFRRQAYVSSLVGASLKRSPSGCRGQVVTVNLETDQDFALFVYYLHKKLEDGDLDRIPRGPATGKRGPEALVAMYSCMPGVGLGKARRLAEAFPSVERLLRATVEELSAVPGLGRKTAKRIYEFLRGNW